MQIIYKFIIKSMQYKRINMYIHPSLSLFCYIIITAIIMIMILLL